MSTRFRFYIGEAVRSLRANLATTIATLASSVSSSALSTLLTDPIPANLTFVPGTLTLGGNTVAYTKGFDDLGRGRRIERLRLLDQSARADRRFGRQRRR